MTIFLLLISVMGSGALAQENQILWYSDQTGICRDYNGEYPRWTEYNQPVTECQRMCEQNGNCQGFSMHKDLEYCQLYGSDGDNPASRPGTRITRGDSSEPMFECYLKHEGNTCTTCDDPADTGVVQWCNANACIPAQDVVPHETPGLGGYCPSIVGRAREENIDIRTCENIYEDILSGGVKLWYTQCGADRIMTSSTSQCAYVLDADSGAKNKVQETAFSARYGLFSPTSQVYQVPGEEDRWYQFFEHGVVVNNADGAEAHAIYQSSRWPVKSRWKEALLNDEVKTRQLYLVEHVPGSGAKERIAYFSGTGTSPSAAVVSQNRFPGDPGFLLEGEVLSFYEDYDDAVPNPDLFDGRLGVPLSERTCLDSTCTQEFVSFQNGIIHIDGDTITAADSISRPCIFCDDANEGLSDETCQTEKNLTSCSSVAGCSWDAAHSVCRGTPQPWCSPNPGDLVCPLVTTKGACRDTSGCSWNNRTETCRSSSPIGAIGERILNRGWSEKSCDRIVKNDFLDGYNRTCTINGESHKVWWGQETQCAYVLLGGSDVRSKIRTRWETVLTSWKASTAYDESVYIRNKNHVYENVKSGTSADDGEGPTGTDPTVDIVDGSTLWRYVGPGKSIGAVLGAPTSEISEVGTGNWIQYFEHGVIVLTAGESYASYLGDPSDGGEAIKRKFKESEQSGELLNNDYWPSYTPNNTEGGRTVSFVKGNESGMLMAPHGGAGHFVLGDIFDLYSAAGGYSGELGWPTTDRIDTGDYAYQLFEGGIITDFGGTLRVVSSLAPSASFWADDRLHNVRQPFCVADNSERALAMEMRRRDLGWGDWTTPESSHHYIYTTYHRSTAEGSVIFTNDTGSHAKCAFYLKGKPAEKWEGWSPEQRYNYGFVSSSIVDVLDDNGDYAGEYVYLRNGVIVYRNGDAEAYVLGAPIVSGIPGYGLKEKFRKKADLKVIHSEGYFPKRDAFAGTSSSCGANGCWIAEFHGKPETDPLGIRFYSSSSAASCGGKTEDTCKRSSHKEGAPYCVWSDPYQQCILGAHEVRGEWNSWYASYGSNGAFDDGYLGIPMTDETCSNPDCTSRYQNFEGGAIFTTGSGTWSQRTRTIEPCTNSCVETGSCSAMCDDVNTFASSSCADAGICATCSPTVCPTDGTGMNSDYLPYTKTCKSEVGIEFCPTWTSRVQGDEDLDGIPDTLERELAEHFAPTLVASRMDMGQLYGYPHELAACPGSDPECQLPFVVREYRSTSGGHLDCSEPYQCLEIQYGLAYNADLGDKGISDGINAIFGVVPVIGGLGQTFIGGPLGAVDPIKFKAHSGDPEHVAILIARSNPVTATIAQSWGTSYETAKTDVDHWRLVMRQSSSHRCTAADSKEWWIWPYWRRGFPKTASQHAADRELVYVSKRKHGSYLTRSRCDDGAFFSDACYPAKGGFLQDFPLAALTNVGEKTRNFFFDTKIAFPGDDARSRSGGAFGLFDVWTGKKFGESSSFEKVLRPGATQWKEKKLYCPD